VRITTLAFGDISVGATYQLANPFASNDRRRRPTLSAGRTGGGEPLRICTGTDDSADRLTEFYATCTEATRPAGIVGSSRATSLAARAYSDVFFRESTDHTTKNKLARSTCQSEVPSAGRTKCFVRPDNPGPRTHSAANKGDVLHSSALIPRSPTRFGCVLAQRLLFAPARPTPAADD